MDVLTVVKRSRIVFPLACVITVAMVCISEGSYWNSNRMLNALSAMGSARTSLQALDQALLDAQAGQRGYLMTGDRDYLQPYDQAAEEIDEAFKALELHYQNDPKRKEVLTQLRSLTKDKLSEFAANIRLQDEGGSGVKNIILRSKGRQQMGAIQTLSAELMADEEANATTGRTGLRNTMMLSRIAMAALSALSLVAVFMYLRQTFALKKAQHEQQRLVQVERDRLEIEVAQRTTQLTELTHHLQTAREDERNRLARNLHDELGALLTSAKLDAARIKSRLAGTAPEALERLAHLVDTLNSGIALGRRIIEDLRPSTLGNLGLVPTLEILAREFSDNSGIEVHCTLEPVALDATAELMIYRLVQEAITNITKYAQASHVWVDLDTTDGHVNVSVRDNGAGFDTSVQPRSAYGLMGMRFRVEAEGGVLSLVSSPGQGTLIKVRLPEAIPAAA